MALAAIIFALSTVLCAAVAWREFAVSERIATYIENRHAAKAPGIAANTPKEEWPSWVAEYVARQIAAAEAAHAETQAIQPPEILPQYAALYAENSDLVGWLKLDGTKIDYPVLQNKQDPEYYLHRGFDKNYLYAGALFLDAKNDILLPSANFLIYGHNMKNGSYFGQLPKYLDRAFFDQQPIFQFDTIYETGDYEVIAVVLTKIYNQDEDAFKYYKWALIDNEADFNYYVENMKALSVYDTGKSAVWGEQLITLSTCYYQTENGRCVVVGRKID
ncbi:MAG: class B sortase [Clostridia bacterium]|nr:class B sortase [Clostridia bacterium]